MRQSGWGVQLNSGPVDRDVAVKQEMTGPLVQVPAAGVDIDPLPPTSLR